MDFYEWGTDYLCEAERLRDYLKPLRRELKTACGEDGVLLERRVSMLYDMYLELLHTGRDLRERGSRR